MALKECRRRRRRRCGSSRWWWCRRGAARRGRLAPPCGRVGARPSRRQDGGFPCERAGGRSFRRWPVERNLHLRISFQILVARPTVSCFRSCALSMFLCCRHLRSASRTLARADARSTSCCRHAGLSTWLRSSGRAKSGKRWKETLRIRSQGFPSRRTNLSERHLCTKGDSIPLSRRTPISTLSWMLRRSWDAGLGESDSSGERIRFSAERLEWSMMEHNIYASEGRVPGTPGTPPCPWRRNVICLSACSPCCRKRQLGRG